MDRPLDLAFGALADPIRRQMLDRMALCGATVLDLAAPFNISQPAISKHLNVLELAGLIETRVAGQSRPRRLNRNAIADHIHWLERLSADWAEKFDRLQDHLSMFAEGEKSV